MYIDKFKMIVTQPNDDGGDSLQRMFTFFLRRFITCQILKNKDEFTPPGMFPILATDTALEVSPGVYRRHPDQSKWYSDPRNVSRDQLTPVICFFALAANIEIDLPELIDPGYAKVAMRQLIVAMLKRGTFAQNVYPDWVDARVSEVTKKIPDLITPDIWGVMARAFIKTLWAPLALPFIVLGDTFLLLTAIVQVVQLYCIKDWANSVDDDNMNNVIQATQYVFPTPMSFLARKIYKHFRRQNSGNWILNEKSAIMGALSWYHRFPSGNPDMANIARPIVEKY